MVSFTSEHAHLTGCVYACTSREWREGRSARTAIGFMALADDVSVALKGGLNKNVKRPNATCPVSSVVKQIGLVCYTNSEVPTTREGNRQLHVCPLE